jgi:ribonuclease E
VEEPAAAADAAPADEPTSAAADAAPADEAPAKPKPRRTTTRKKPAAKATKGTKDAEPEAAPRTHPRPIRPPKPRSATGPPLDGRARSGRRRA